MKTKYYFLVGVMAILFAACSTSKRAIMTQPSGDVAIAETVEAFKTEDTEKTAETTTTNTAERKVIYDVTLRLIVDTIKNESSEVLKIANAYGGYVLFSRKDYAKIRVPSDELQSALADLKSLGEVEEESITGQDVTDKYYDIQTRLESTIKTKERYEALLQKAVNVDEVLRIERELERLNTTIESYKGQIKRLDELEAFATIAVYFREVTPEKVVKPGPLGYVFVGLYKGIKWLFVREGKS